MDLGYWKLDGIKLGGSCKNVKWEEEVIWP